MSFKPGFTLSRPKTNQDLWFIVRDGKLVLKKDSNGPRIPRTDDLQSIQSRVVDDQYFGTKDGCPCFIAEWKPEEPMDEDFEARGLFEIFGLFEDDMILAAGCGAQLVRWNKTHLYCGRCGKPTTAKKDERARVCTDCDLTYYPRLSPAVIMAVIKDNRILLARSARFPVGFYSVLAGFVEPGETLEECVAREVFEEVGIVVQNIRYFGSQPWPFPDSLMLGFTAEYAAGEIRTDSAEIADARWFASNALPDIPPRISIARQLIDWFTQHFRCEA